MTITEAKEFVNYNIKEGIWCPEDFESMTEKEIIEFAEYEIARADDRANDNEKS